MDYRHDEWGVDVTVGGSQKGLMLPPGLSFNAVSEKALAAHRGARLPRGYFDWTAMLEANRRGFFPYTPATNLLFGLAEAILMLHEEGLERVFARHERHAAATRAAVEAWGLEIVARLPAERSASLTGVLVPEGVDADALRATILDHFDLSLGAGLGKLAGRCFRIGHLGDLNDLTLIATLAGVEMGLRLFGLRPRSSGLEAAQAVLLGELTTARAAA
jgi:alanine-glyoxylate transaminase/serine-glyoxylate transaminase/serine-pyruvate transaminase